MPVSSNTRIETLKNPHRQVWAVAGPAIIANSATPLVGLVDTWAIGQIPDAAHMAAVGVGATVFAYVFWAFGFLRMGTTGLVAQAKGRGDTTGMLRIVVRSVILGIGVALCLLILQRGLFHISVAALAPPDSTKALYHVYFNIRIWSAPAILVLYAITGYLIGVARARAALVLQLVLNLANAVLNLWFVLGLDMGVEGIALGSLIAEWVAAILGLTMLVQHFSRATVFSVLAEKALWRWQGFINLAQTNVYIFVRTLLLMTALSLVTRRAGLIGEEALAASHVLNVFMLLISLGLDGFAYAVEALAGAAYGKNVRHNFSYWVTVTTQWAAFASLLYTLLFYLFGHDIIYILTENAGVRDAAAEALGAIIWLPVASVWCYQLDGIFIAATAAHAMMITMALSFSAFAIILGPMASMMGLAGIWYSVVIFSLCRGLFQLVYYPRIVKTLK